jgi:hypothetical protein
MCGASSIEISKAARQTGRKGEQNPGHKIGSVAVIKAQMLGSPALWIIGKAA